MPCPYKKMSIGIKKLNHVNVTVPAAVEAAAKDFYGVLLGLPQIAKPAGSRQNVGAWYELEGAQIHLSPEDGANNEASDRHVCYQVNDIEKALREFRDAGIELIPDSRPVAGQTRFFVRDPGGNLLEITQTKE
jgi:catechol 2,3-dioxygenase-like lactoylglutathione lyase family enzyme